MSSSGVLYLARGFYGFAPLRRADSASIHQQKPTPAQKRTLNLLLEAPSVKITTQQLTTLAYFQCYHHDTWKPIQQSGVLVVPRYRSPSPVNHVRRNGSDVSFGKFLWSFCMLLRMAFFENIAVFLYRRPFVQSFIIFFNAFQNIFGGRIFSHLDLQTLFSHDQYLFFRSPLLTLRWMLFLSCCRPHIL